MNLIGTFVVYAALACGLMVPVLIAWLVKLDERVRALEKTLTLLSRKEEH